MSKSKQSGRKSDATSGLKMVGGAAAGAAAGSLMGPLGAAVGAVVGGIAGANSPAIAKSKAVKKLTSATKSAVTRTMQNKSVKLALKKAPGMNGLAKKASAKRGPVRNKVRHKSKRSK